MSFFGSKTKQVHSKYQREVQDLPIQDGQVILLVNTRKIFCNNSEYLQKKFLRNIRLLHQKKTVRLIKNIIYTSTQLSSLNASKLLKIENIAICKSSICDLIKKCHRLRIRLP